MRRSTGVLLAVLPVQLPANASGKVTEVAQHLGPSCLSEKTGYLVPGSWASSGRAPSRSFTFCVPLPFKQIYLILKKVPAYAA